MKYRMLFDYHTHTTFSHGFTKNKPHGKGTIEENIKVAFLNPIKSLRPDQQPILQKKGFLIS